MPGHRNPPPPGAKRKGGPGRPPGEFVKAGGKVTATAPTPAKMAQVLIALGKGHTRTAAAALAGIHRQRLYDWVNRDPEFAEACDIAEATAEAQVAEAFQVAALNPADHRAALAWLEHRRRVDWRPPTNTTEVSGPDGGPIALADARAKVQGVLDRIANAGKKGSAARRPKPD